MAYDKVASSGKRRGMRWCAIACKKKKASSGSICVWRPSRIADAAVYASCSPLITYACIFFRRRRRPVSSLNEAVSAREVLPSSASVSGSSLKQHRRAAYNTQHVCMTYQTRYNYLRRPWRLSEVIPLRAAATAKTAAAIDGCAAAAEYSSIYCRALATSVMKFWLIRW